MNDLQSFCSAGGSCLRDAEAESLSFSSMGSSLWSPGMTIFSHFLGAESLTVSKILEAMLPKLLEIKDDIPPLRWNL